MTQIAVELDVMNCASCKMEWSTREVEGFTPYQVSQFKEGVGCPNCVYLVQVIVCLNSDGRDSGMWQRIEVAVGKDVHLSYVEAQAETDAWEMMTALGQTVTAVLAECIIGECEG